MSIGFAKEARSPASQALDAWRRIVGEKFVIASEEALTAAATTTFPTAQSVPAIVLPKCRTEVQACLRVAQECGIPVYPISRGKNWGYGSRVPPRSAVILDLSRMNRIVEFNEKLAYVTIEPGVTQGQLYEFLRQSSSRLWMDATGAGPDSSIVGNILERGFGHTPYGDHFAHACGFEVVLATGECVETGFSRFEGAKTGPLYRWGVGPYIDGLFTQSNFGIVTRMTVWLMPAPEQFEAFYYSCANPEDLIGVIEALRPLKLDGTLRSAMHIANDYKVLSALQQYPWEETGGATPLQSENFSKLKKDLKIGCWNGSGALYGTRNQVKEARRLVKKALAGKVQKLQFLDDRKLALASRFAKPYELLTGWNLRRTLELLRPVYGLMKGIPTSHPLFSTYWRKKTAPPLQMDPDRDGCGLLWCAPVAPSDGENARELCDLANLVILGHGFEPAISITMITERALTCVISIAYDRCTPGEDERAMRCYRELIAELKQAGYHSYRLGIQVQGENEQPDYSALLSTLRNALDPRGILAPGRYQGTTGSSVLPPRTE